MPREVMEMLMSGHSPKKPSQTGFVQVFGLGDLRRSHPTTMTPCDVCTSQQTGWIVYIFSGVFLI